MNQKAGFSICLCGWLNERITCRMITSREQGIWPNPNNLHYKPSPLKICTAQESLETRMMNTRGFRKFNVITCISPSYFSNKNIKWEKLLSWERVSVFFITLLIQLCLKSQTGFIFSRPKFHSNVPVSLFYGFLWGTQIIFIWKEPQQIQFCCGITHCSCSILFRIKYHRKLWEA